MTTDNDRRLEAAATETMHPPVQPAERHWISGNRGQNYGLDRLSDREYLVIWERPVASLADRHAYRLPEHDENLCWWLDREFPGIAALHLLGHEALVWLVVELKEAGRLDTDYVLPLESFGCNQARERAARALAKLNRALDDVAQRSLPVRLALSVLRWWYRLKLRWRR